MNSNGTFQRKDCAKLLRYLKQQDVKKNLPKAATIQQQCQHNEKIVDKRKKSSRTQKIYGTSSHIDKIGKEFSNSGKRLRQSNKQTNRKVQLDNDIQLKQDVQNLLKKLNDKSKLHVFRASPTDILPVLFKVWNITHLVFEKVS